ncbi:hypothetical protein B277_15659 [Janibacter hoylei PVAS-1]|uniref:WXG100 family type VII secretion target n=1 Tax=Janibacter hoylei PVAS-1 TaxID=1210046 RepID=K1EKQ4_9MICO|nr:hypothetical protein [Janibacter hoylei]EKA59908.1 hypothetical protein B277_15659 [Janibacter hoylei PVAS-1]
MTVREGMDSSRVREVASGLDTQVHRLGEILVRGNASAAVLGDNWGGEDGQELLRQWRDDAGKQVGAASEMLRSISSELRRQADDQDRGSGGQGSGGGTRWSGRSGRTRSRAG